MTTPNNAATSTAAAAPPFKFCLNTSTIRGQKLSLADEIDLAAEAGYDAIEPWISELESHAKQNSGSLADVRKRLADHKLAVPSAIGFFEWIVHDEARRKTRWSRPDATWIWWLRSAARTSPRRPGARTTRRRWAANRR